MYIVDPIPRKFDYYSLIAVSPNTGTHCDDSRVKPCDALNDQVQFLQGMIVPKSMGFGPDLKLGRL
jgi:hypothetical protein